MKLRVGACALLVCLAGCTAEAPDTKFGDQWGAASAGARTAQRLPSVQAARQTSQSVANAPDHGELISYKNKGAAIKREGAYTWYPVAISEAHALKAVFDGVMSIPSPDGSQVKVRYERHIEHTDGNWTWIGRVIGGDQNQEAILTFGEKAVYGSIPQETGAALSVQTRGGQLYAVQTDLSKAKNPNSRTDMMMPPALALRSALLASTSEAQVSQAAVESTATAANTIDVAIGYTAGFATARGSQSAAVTRLVFLIDVGNEAFTNSLIDGALRLVNSVQVSYTDSTTNEAALGELTGHNGTTTVQVPASLTPIRTARDQYGADLAVLVRQFQNPENDGCGIAWLNGADQTAINPATDDDFGYAVISDGTDGDYYCAPETLVHELGHLMGSAHDRDNSQKDDGSLLYGRYPYSFGMKTTAANGYFYTIMAYGDIDQNFYRTFSNPLVLKCGAAGNLSCGVTDQTDNARSLNQIIPVVAQFRATIVPFQGIPNLEAIKKNGSTSTEVHTLAGYANFQSYTRHLATALGRTGSDASWVFQFGNYNSDNVPDLYAIKKTGASGKLEVHVLNGADGFKTYLLHIATAQGAPGAGLRWEFKIGDYNNDGRPDLYAIDKSGASGKVDVHVLNGANGFQSYLLHSASVLTAISANDGWKFELGKYDSNNSLDLYAIKKVGSSGRTEVHVLNGADGFKTFLLQKSTILASTGTDNAWDFKVADHDKDGKSDLYAIKKNGSSGRTEVHIMNGANQFQTYLLQTATALAATGSDHSWEFVLTVTQ